MPRVSQVHSLSVNLKYKNRNYDADRKKRVNYVGYLETSKNGTSWLVQPGFLSSYFASSCVIQLAICLLEMNVFEIDVLAIKSLMSQALTLLKERLGNFQVKRD